MNGAPVVVGVDGSPASLAALRWAVTEAAATGREVRAVAAWSYAPALEPGGTVLPVDEMAAGHRRRLDEVIARTVGADPGVKIDAQLIEGDPVDALLEASKDASLLALGSHGRGLLLTALLGSVSARCLRRATCPVLIIPAQVAQGETAEDLATTSYERGPML